MVVAMSSVFLPMTSPFTSLFLKNKYFLQVIFMDLKISIFNHDEWPKIINGGLIDKWH